MHSTGRLITSEPVHERGKEEVLGEWLGAQGMVVVASVAVTTHVSMSAYQHGRQGAHTLDQHTTRYHLMSHCICVMEDA